MKRFVAILAGLAILGTGCGGGEKPAVVVTVLVTPPPPTLTPTPSATDVYKKQVRDDLTLIDAKAEANLADADAAAYKGRAVTLEERRKVRDGATEVGSIAGRLRTLTAPDCLKSLESDVTAAANEYGGVAGSVVVSEPLMADGTAGFFLREGRTKLTSARTKQKLVLVQLDAAKC